MSIDLEPMPGPLAAAPWGNLPPRMRVLFVTTAARTGGWLAEALSCDSASKVALEEALGFAEGMARLREQVFDAVLVSHHPGELDALDFVEGLRAGGSEEPLVVLGTHDSAEIESLVFEVDADAYVSVESTTVRTMLWVVARAIERHNLIRENGRLNQAERNRLGSEQREAERLLGEQRTLLAELEQLEADAARDAAQSRGGEQPAEPARSLPEPLRAHYRELLRTQVMMGSGNLTQEVAGLADLLVSAQVGASQALQLHVGVLEELIRGLGNRSARHVMTRADLLVVELLAQLAAGYRRRYVDRIHPPSQQFLPGFDPAAAS
jgi:DNA-binding response OmpR family regulator